jgi:CRISPR-associated protein Csx17
MNPQRHDIELRGCAPTPLAHYLKALGILRLIAEQADSSAQGWWERDTFWLRSTLDKAALVKFFLEDYSPTPIVVPWSGSDYFLVNSSVSPNDVARKWPESSSRSRPKAETAIEAFLTEGSPRIAQLRAVLADVLRCMSEAKISEKSDLEPAKGNRKAEFLTLLRNRLPDLCIHWLDTACMVNDLEKREVTLNCLLGGGGGSDGNANFSDNFLQCLWLVLPDFDWQRSHVPQSLDGPFVTRNALLSSLFECELPGTVIHKLSPALFDSGSIGGANATVGFDADSASNPWNYIMMLEGAVLCSGAASRRYGEFATRETTFPFSVELSPVGTPSSSQAEKGPMAREFWLPLWSSPTNFLELSQIFSEARLTLQRRAAKSGIDVARAIASFGNDRGIYKYQRLTMVRGRIGGDNYYTACDAGAFFVHSNPGVEELLAPLDSWLERFRRGATGKLAPARAGRTLRLLENAILQLCQRGNAADVQALLIALGAAEAALAVSKALREGGMGAGIPPVPLLATDWLVKACDSDRRRNVELRLAAALASVAHKTVGPFRRHLEPIDVDRVSGNRPRAQWAEGETDPALVWGGGDLVRNLNAVLSRRLIDIMKAGKQSGDTELYAPLHGKCFATLGDITAFIQGEVDDNKIEALARGLMLLNWNLVNPEDLTLLGGDQQPLPSATYALLKLCHLPHPLTEGLSVRLSPQIARRALAGDAVGATQLAARRLRASGFPPAVDQTNCSRQQILRTTAALMFPISRSATRKLAEAIVARHQQIDTEPAADPAAAVPELHAK